MAGIAFDVRFFSLFNFHLQIVANLKIVGFLADGHVKHISLDTYTRAQFVLLLLSSAIRQTDVERSCFIQEIADSIEIPTV